MRTTVTIDDDLLRRAKALAARTGRNLGDVVDDALRVLLTDRADATETDVVLPTFGGSGFRLGVDLEDRDAIADLLDERDDARAAS